MKAIVLVGGEGIRLRPLTATIPKQLLPVAVMSMLERVVSRLAAGGVDEAVLSMGYQPDAFLAAFPNDRCAGVRLSYAVEPEPLDTAGAIRFAALHAGLRDRFIVVNGDVLTGLDLHDLLDFHRERGAEASVHLARVDEPSAFGVVPTDERGRVLAFVEKPPPGQAPTDFINAGTYVLEPSVVDRIPDGRRASIERETFPAMVADGTLFGMTSDVYWIDAGTPSKFLQANLDLLEADDPPVPGAARREDGVWTLGSAVLDGDVRPPALVDDAAFVARDALVAQSVVGAGARVLEGAEVREAVLFPGAVVRPRASVHCSIVGPGAVVGDGAKVADQSVVGGGAEVPAGACLLAARVPA